ncbi:hypothetical protein [Staphylococcus haemolyticus]|uniref:hypothetical protein n=1 Tax=Staphylococcus haemolyticus TaxID=1283 RepID=UPI0008248760|nr:hypothetical protein [Staphylococcus haemolyticus]MBC3101959.1 hypothetical protein [Staphylococcus haemolyticus]MBC3142816.1 hypothetical protein [Staphylococcus haemolyticus]MCC3722448.1 hypothetical protein [Staphylococcus haemolyticus]MDO0970895.1 hypothetical protein [Staphylococcus haemolyticus]OCX37209.1 hypothetical protein KV48_03145 [Staphylococcus haemolyticus]
MTTTEFIEAVKRLGYKVNISYKNVNHKKTKLLIYTENERHPSAWVFVHEQYSFRSLGINSELFTLLVMYASTAINERGANLCNS